MNGYYNNFDNYTQQSTQNTYTPAPQVTKKKSGGAKVAALALCFSLLGGAVGTGGTYLMMNNSQSNTSAVVADSSSSSEKDPVVLKTVQPQAADSTVKTDTDSSKADKMTAAEVYKANVDSTVGITTSINTNYFGYKTTAAAAGSGFIISKDGYIVTNYHVIDDATKITVTLYNGKKYNAELVGGDEGNDIAVLKIDASDLKPVKLGSSSALNVGDDVATIGNPLGELTFSLTTGVVSALDRTITTENSTMTLIQTDTAINSGNSGGALFNMNGEVIGITNAKYSGSGSSTSASIDNIAFAIPIDSVKSMIDSIISSGYAVKSYIGIGAVDVSDETAQGDVTEGAVIKKVYEDSPAEKAGLKENDIITEVNGRKIKSSGEMTSAVKASSVGSELVCKVYRNGEFIEVKVTVGQSGTQTNQSDTKQSEQKQSQQKQNRDSYDNYDGYDYFGDFPFDR